MNEYKLNKLTVTDKATNANIKIILIFLSLSSILIIFHFLVFENKQRKKK